MLVVLGVVSFRPWGALVIAVAAAVDIAESLFWIWLSKRRHASLGGEAFVGEVVTVARPCRPLGYVRVHGELWQALCDEGADAGDQVRVVGADGLTLRVERG